MADDFKARSRNVAVPTPPRRTGNPDADMRSITEWFEQFYRSAVNESGLLDPNYQSSGADFTDLSQLPDPLATTIARAQHTANLIVQLYYPLIERALRRPAERVPYSGRVTITGADDTASVAFPFELPNTDYRVAITCVGYTGNPATNSFALINVTKGVGGMGFETLAAPGAGATTVWEWIVVRTLVYED